MPQGVISIKSPSSVGFADSFPTQGGSLLVWLLPTILPSPGGRGTARNERWMRDVSDKLMLPNSVTLLLQRAQILGIVSRERFLGVELSWLRAYRAASRPLGSKKTFFGHVGFRSLCSLNVRSKNLSVSRFARNFSAFPPFGGEGGISTKGRNDG